MNTARISPDTADLSAFTDLSILEDFFRNAAVPLHLVGPDGIILRANNAELDLLGYTREEYVGRSIADFHADPETIDDILMRLRGGETLHKYPARLRAKDGTLRYVEITSSVNFKNGKFINTRCFSVDVTETTLAKAKLTESEERFRQLLEALPAAVYTTDEKGRITYYNQAARELAGREPVLGTDEWCVTWRLYRADGTPLPHHECPMAVALKENRPIRGVEAIAERPDGTRIPFMPFPTPLRDAEGNLVGAVNMLVDVSERRQAEAHQRVLLDELNHRVKNNLQMLHALVSGTLREATNPQARELLTDIGRRIGAMAAAQQVLYDSIGPRLFGARDFLDSMIDMARATFAKNVNVRITAASGTLSNETAVPLSLILNELLTNAVKHGVGGRGDGQIGVSLTGANGAFALTVEDDGAGFEPSSVVKRASGLGLVRGLARQLGGEVTFERAPGARCAVRFADRSYAH